MATVLLQVVGSTVGGAIGGPFGAIIGRAIGGIAGYALDQRGGGKDTVINGPRLESSGFLTSTEGAPIPRTYGQTRLGGQIIWATRFLEVITSSKQKTGGGKGGGSSSSTTVREYSYFGNFAIGLCDGEISGIRRIWADGEQMDLAKVEYRLHRGTEGQQPDPLIEAKQGLGNAPAYRGSAYIVFESLPLEQFGNRIPQISVEVIRSVDTLASDIKSISVIPGATEFGYHPQNISKFTKNGITTAGNRHNLISRSDWSASIDELQSLCPNLETVVLVVAWFGTDLRAGLCQIIPGVEFRTADATAAKWEVSGISADEAFEVSKINGKPAYGGTPSDQSVIAAIADLKSRGLKVSLYPFIMMDIPSDNGLPDPYGNPAQAVYPWRGIVTCDPAIGQPDSSDQTAGAADQIDDICGDATAGDFSASGDTIAFSGSTQWSFRRMILHYAKLGELAGGLDQFVIGSEMRGLTSVRDDNNSFPFVAQLVSLAGEAKSILGNTCRITYAADWSEYFGYHPQDGSNDLYFNLDPLWSSSDIDLIGIDNYMPLSDMRDGQSIDNPEAPEPDTSITSLRNDILGGEGYDWYYQSSQDRLDQIRTPITDGLGEPWVWRYKDVVSWWENSHHERIGGQRQINPTTWIPKSKPIAFTEIGCPAIDKGSNQPNVFYDPKSDQSDLPYFSSGGRDDLIQNRFLKAHLAHWNPADPQFDPMSNPVSTQYAGRMLDQADITLWTWDARPFPWFPSLSNLWSDGQNWERGHWLNGRLSGCSLDGLITQILNDYGFQDFRCEIDGFVDGFLIPDAGSLRTALDPLLAFFGVLVSEENEIGRASCRERV